MTKENIKELRFKLHMTQQQFANKLKVSLGTVKLWETKEGTKSERLLYRLNQLISDNK